MKTIIFNTEKGDYEVNIDNSYDDFEEYFNKKLRYLTLGNKVYKLTYEYKDVELLHKIFKKIDDYGTLSLSNSADELHCYINSTHKEKSHYDDTLVPGHDISNWVTSSKTKIYIHTDTFLDLFGIKRIGIGEDMTNVKLSYYDKFIENIED